jgi:hypothetical protein
MDDLTSKKTKKHAKRGKTGGQFNIADSSRHEVNLYVEELDTIPMDTN